MGRISVILDEEVDYGFEGGPAYKTGIVDLENGFEDRDAEHDYPKHEYNASFGNIDDPDRDAMINVFHACRGRAHSFGFLDWNDYLIVDQEFIVGSIGTHDPVQLYKRYEWGEAFTIRPIQRIKTAVISDNLGDPVAGVLDVLTGIFTPTDAWGVGPYTLDAEFYVWVRFDADYNPMTIKSWRANTANVRLVEDKFKFTPTNVPLSWAG